MVEQDYSYIIEMNKQVEKEMLENKKVDLNSIMRAEAKERFERMVMKYVKNKGRPRKVILEKILTQLGKNPRQTLIDAGLHSSDVEAYLKEIEQES